MPRTLVLFVSALSAVMQAGCLLRNERRPESAPLPPKAVPAEPPLARTMVSTPADSRSTNPEVVLASDPGPAPTARDLIRTALKRHAEIDSFQARLTRRDTGRGKPTEVIQFKYRRQPLSVHMRWISEQGQGREVLWVENKYEGKLQILTAGGDVPLVGPGHRMSMSPDSPLVRATSPHHIREAGMCGTCAAMAKKLGQDQAEPAKDWVRYLGRVRRPEYPEPMEAVELTFAPGEDRLLPRGGRWQVFFDPDPGSPSHGLPVVVVAMDDRGQEVEYIAFDRFLYPIGLDDMDFDSDFLWDREPS